MLFYLQNPSLRSAWEDIKKSDFEKKAAERKQARALKARQVLNISRPRLPRTPFQGCKG